MRSSEAFLALMIPERPQTVEGKGGLNASQTQGDVINSERGNEWNKAQGGHLGLRYPSELCSRWGCIQVNVP